MSFMRREDTNFMKVVDQVYSQTWQQGVVSCRDSRVTHWGHGVEWGCCPLTKTSLKTISRRELSGSMRYVDHLSKTCTRTIPIFEWDCDVPKASSVHAYS